MTHNFSTFVGISKYNFHDIIHFNDVIFVMNNDEFSKNYFQSIENQIFFLFTLFFLNFYPLKSKIIITFSAFGSEAHVLPLDTFWLPSNEQRDQLKPNLFSCPVNSCRYRSGKLQRHRRYKNRNKQGAHSAPGAKTSKKFARVK